MGGRCTREEAYAALFALVSTTPAPEGTKWGEIDRNFKNWDQVAAANQPALFFVQDSEEALERTKQGVIKWRWYSAVVVYFRCSTVRIVEDWQFMNALLDSLEETIQGKPPGERQTLGGIIYDCYIEGSVAMYPAEDDPNQGVILIPIVMLTGI